MIMAAFVVLLLFNAVTANSGEMIYKAEGGEVVLTPGSVAHPIDNMMWKHDTDIAVLWDGEETQAYRQFEGHGVLNTTTGTLTLTGLTQIHSGSYIAEVNGRVTNTAQLQVISPVTKPVVSTWCDPAMTHCILTCEGNATDSGPLSYRWQASGKVWCSTNMCNITKDMKEWLFMCTLENPVGAITSNPVINPLIKRNWMFTLMCLIPLAGGILVVCVLFFRHKHRKERTYMISNGGGALQNVESVACKDNNNATETPLDEVTVTTSHEQTNGQKTIHEEQN
ncbi:lymphocyte function-associated antigen 3-like [Chaetodon auriga]|uniref:lymphocyte function-associated antigen 3-like n=1 Tax=Chaetodon auriga TaxID=39042 RepID=UPI004032BEE9